MPMLAKILSQKHGFECKVLFAGINLENTLTLTIRKVFAGGIILKMPIS